MFIAAKLHTIYSFNFLLISFLSLLIISFSSYSADFATGFEFTDTTEEFTRGVSPNTVTFKNGHAKTAAIASLYHDGMNAFMVQNNTGMVEFETPAGMVDVWLRAQTGAVSGGAEVRVYDINSNLTNTFMATTQWQQITLASVDGISRLELVNNSSSYAVFDTFSFTAIDSPPGPLDDPLPIPIAVGGLKLKLELLTSDLVAPLWGVNAPGVADFIYVIDQVGSIWAINTITGIKSEIADLSPLLVTVGIEAFGGYDERGLLGLAFHPDFANNGKLYTYTSEPISNSADFTTMPVAGTGDHLSVLREWSATLGGDSGIIIDNAQSHIILSIEQPQFNHNGGALAFDSSGLLYVSLGDGGNADDQGDGHGLSGNAQDNSNLLGTIIRIDPGDNGNYSIPASNPFVNSIDMHDEIFAFGLRNPYRMSFDAQTGDLYAADVGQNAIEEINLVTVGGNYGWNKREGSFGFDPNDADDGFVFEQVDAMGTINPIVEYDHDEGRAVIGGFIYRGETYENLQGRYLFADFDGPVFYINKEQTISIFKDEDTIDFGKVLGFGQDANNELYLLTNSNGLPNGNSGNVYKITVLPNTAPVADAGPDQTVNEGATVSLDASASSDIDGDSLIYQWTQLGGTTVTLSDMTAEKPSFTAPTVNTNEILTFKVEVHDEHLAGEFADEVDIMVQNIVAPEPMSGGGGGGGGGALGYLWLLIVLAGLNRRCKD